MSDMDRTQKIAVTIFCALWIALFVLGVLGVIGAPDTNRGCAVEYTAEGC